MTLAAPLASTLAFLAAISAGLAFGDRRERRAYLASSAWFAAAAGFLIAIMAGATG